MIECINCETSQFLQITNSLFRFRDGKPYKVVELYHCTLCDSTGEVTSHDSDLLSLEISGDIKEDRGRPLNA